MTEHDNYKKCEEIKECSNYDKHGISIPKPVISIPQATFESKRGRYFIGQTDYLTFDHDCYAWGGLINPSDSGVNLYIGTFTLSNFTDTPFVGQIWFNTTLPDCSNVSDKVSPGNTALCPLPEPKVKLRYDSCVEKKPRRGANPFLRITEPYSTLVAEQEGREIIPPGGNFVITLKSINTRSRDLIAKIVFGWWEEKTYSKL